MPEEGEDIVEHLTKKYGPSAQQRFNDPNSSMKQSGRAVGIEFTNDRRVYPTIKAHTLIEHVKNDLSDNEKANSIMNDLYERYFEQGENVSSVDLLQQVATSANVNVSKEIINDDQRHAQIRELDMQHNVISLQYAITVSRSNFNFQLL